MTVENILRDYHLKSTTCRKFILNELLRSQTALTEHEIKTSFPDLFDRVTFYRTLKTLEDAGVIHKIVLQDNTIRYAVSKKPFHEQDIHSIFIAAFATRSFVFKTKAK